jgi:cytochrome d ubiquinol oxidase subunit II
MLSNLVDDRWRLAFPLLAVAALVALFVYQRRGLWGRAFTASSLFIVGVLTTAAAGLYPNILPAREGAPGSLTVENAIAGDTVLRTALIWWPLALALACAYFALAYRMVLQPARSSNDQR